MELTVPVDRDAGVAAQLIEGDENLRERQASTPRVGVGEKDIAAAGRRPTWGGVRLAVGAQKVVDLADFDAEVGGG